MPIIGLSEQVSGFTGVFNARNGRRGGLDASAGHRYARSPHFAARLGARRTRLDAGM
jgi:hypothetical protein